MAPEDAARAFERFYRADLSRARTAGGTGLGLAIVSALVAAHGGTVDLDTAPGRGAAFTVRLPRSGPGGPQSAPGGDDPGAGWGPGQHWRLATVRSWTPTRTASPTTPT
jgi:two-component system, OmpR family, sensor kinase